MSFKEWFMSQPWVVPQNAHPNAILSFEVIIGVLMFLLVGVLIMIYFFVDAKKEEEKEGNIRLIPYNTKGLNKSIC